LDFVQRFRSGQVAQLFPKRARPFGLIFTVMPFGQVTVLASLSISKSSMV
jgi:hypothetical protein